MYVQRKPLKSRREMLVLNIGVSPEVPAERCCLRDRQQLPFDMDRTGDRECDKFCSDFRSYASISAVEETTCTTLLVMF